MRNINKHKEYRKKVKDSSTVILFIHGILGTPIHFKKFIKYVPKNWSICNLLLTGHGLGVEEFAKSNIDIWKNQVHEEIEILKQSYDNIYIVAHSMGTLFAINETIVDDLSKIKNLFLLAPPLNTILKPAIVRCSFNILFDKIKENDLVGIASKEAYGIDIDRNLFKYLSWIHVYLGLFKEIKNVRKDMGKLNIPSEVFISKNDELVSTSAIKYFENNEKFKIYELKNSSHFYYEASDYEFLLNKFKEFCERNNSNGN